jgi:hypothetical protein
LAIVLIWLFAPGVSCLGLALMFLFGGFSALATAFALLGLALVAVGVSQL